MRINFSIYMKATLLKIIFCLFLLVQLSNLHAQNFTHQASAIEFLDRMAQKGNIEFNDLMKPVDRTTVYNLLAQLQNKSNLLPIEKKEIIMGELNNDKKDLIKQNNDLIEDKCNLIETIAHRNGFIFILQEKNEKVLEEK